MTNKIIGKYGEQIAKNFLIKKGFEIIEMNFRYSKMAEIDIIAAKDNILHFVEVKTRSNDMLGNPLEAITPKKLKSIYLCARYYLSVCKKRYSKLQIDALAIMLNKAKEDNFKDEFNTSFEHENHKITFIENISL